MGYDDPQSLGSREFGATLALPIWTDFMGQALKGKPATQWAPPTGVSQTEGDWVYDEFIAESSRHTIDLDASAQAQAQMQMQMQPQPPK